MDATITVIFDKNSDIDGAQLLAEDLQNRGLIKVFMSDAATQGLTVVCDSVFRDEVMGVFSDHGYDVI